MLPHVALHPSQWKPGVLQNRFLVHVPTRYMQYSNIRRQFGIPFLIVCLAVLLSSNVCLANNEHYSPKIMAAGLMITWISGGYCSHHNIPPSTVISESRRAFELTYHGQVKGNSSQRKQVLNVLSSYFNLPVVLMAERSFAKHRKAFLDSQGGCAKITSEYQLVQLYSNLAKRKLMFPELNTRKYIMRSVDGCIDVGVHYLDDGRSSAVTVARTVVQLCQTQVKHLSLLELREVRSLSAHTSSEISHKAAYALLKKKLISSTTALVLIHRANSR